MKNEKKHWKIFAAVLLGCASLALAFERESVSAEDAFWAYDDGQIGYDELEDLLESIESGDAKEACAKWEALGGDSCQRTLTERLAEWKFRANAKYAVSFDSAGNIRNETAALSLGFWRFSGEVRVQSEERENLRVEYGRVLYEGRFFRNALGNLVAADLESKVPLQKILGDVATFKFKRIQPGAFLLADSSAGVHAKVDWYRSLKFSSAAHFSRDGFQSAFLRTQFSSADFQILYADSWKTPLFFISGKSGISPLRLNFRAYFHGNDSLPGLFRLPKRVESSRAFASANAQMNLRPWNFRLSTRFSIPSDSGKMREFAEVFAERKSQALFAAGLRTNSVGDSIAVTGILRSGVRLFSAESLFAEWRLTPDFSGKNSLYEIRPGVQIPIEDGVSTKWLLILRGPMEKPLALRNVTEMAFSKNLFGKSSVEWRAFRLRKMHLWRLGLSFSGKW